MLALVGDVVVLEAKEEGEPFEEVHGGGAPSVDQKGGGGDEGR